MNFTKRIFILSVKWIFLLFMATICVGPLIWIFLSSFKTNNEIFTSAFSMPVQFSLKSYIEAIKMAPIFDFYINSIVISVVSTVLNVICISMAAYVLARFTFKGKKWLTILLSSSLLIPTTALLMPIYIIMTKINLYDTRIGLILVYAALGLPTSLFILRSYFLDIPKEIEEAAYIDGAGFFRTFFTIIMPLVKPGIATAAILQFLLSWNEFMFALVLTKSKTVRTLPLALNYFKSQFSYNYPAMFAAIIMVALPSIVIYALLQEQVTESMVTGSVKG